MPATNSHSQLSAAHHSAPFLAWHRYFLHVYETQLRSVCNYSGSLVYVSLSRLPSPSHHPSTADRSPASSTGSSTRKTWLPPPSGIPTPVLAAMATLPATAASMLPVASQTALLPTSRCSSTPSWTSRTASRAASSRLPIWPSTTARVYPRTPSPS